jgi:hypothetical protein
MHTLEDNSSIKVNLVCNLASNNAAVIHSLDNFAMDKLEQVFSCLAAEDTLNKQVSSKLLSPSECAIQAQVLHRPMPVSKCYNFVAPTTTLLVWDLVSTKMSSLFITKLLITWHEIWEVSCSKLVWHSLYCLDHHISL